MGYTNLKSVAVSAENYVVLSTEFSRDNPPLFSLTVYPHDGHDFSVPVSGALQLMHSVSLYQTCKPVNTTLIFLSLQILLQIGLIYLSVCMATA